MCEYDAYDYCDYYRILSGGVVSQYAQTHRPLLLGGDFYFSIECMKRFENSVHLVMGGGEGWLGCCSKCGKDVYAGKNCEKSPWGGYWHKTCPQEK